MNKVLNYIKYLLILLLIFLHMRAIIFLHLFALESLPLYIYLLLLIIYIGLSIKDLYHKNKIIDNKLYNILSVIVLLIITFIFIRANYDKHFLFMNDTFIETYNVFSHKYEVNNFYYHNLYYINQNLVLFIVMLISLLGYRKINMEKVESKYHIVSLICFYISLISVFVSLITLESTSAVFIIGYFIFTSILVGIEIYRLIKDNHKKREWIIFLSFLFNLWAYISIFINVHLLFQRWL